MTQIVLNVEDVSLVPSLKQILGALKGVTIDRLTPKTDAVEAEKEFVAKTIKLGYRQAQDGEFAGRNLTSLDNLVAELRAEAE